MPELREAIAAAVADRGYRQVARDVGLDHKALMKFLDGAHPRPPTKQKLERWHVSWVLGSGTVDVTTAAAAIQTLVRDLPAKRQAPGTADILATLERLYSARGVERPGWIAALLERGQPSSEPESG